MVAALLVCATGPAVVAHAQTLLTVALSPVTTPVNSGDVLIYALNVQCSNPTGCGTITATMPAPAGWTSAAGTPSASLSPAQIAAGITQSADSAGTLTLTWPNATAGNSQQIQVNWPTQNYLTAPGPQTVTVTASDTAGDTVEPSTATVQLNAVPNPELFKSGPSIAVAGGTVSYLIFARNIQTNPTSAEGGLALDNVVISDVLPPGVTFVSCSDGCTYDSGTHTATWPAIPRMAGDQAGRTITYTLPATAQPDDTFTNTARLEATPFGSTTPIPPLTATAVTTIPSGPPVVEAYTYKGTDYSVAAVNGPANWYINVGNRGNVDASLVMRDDLPAGFNATAIGSFQSNSTGAPPPSGTTIVVTYSDSSQETLTWPGSRLDITKPGVRVTNITVTIPNVSPSTTYGIIINGTIDASATPGSTITNCQSTTVSAPGVADDTATDCSSLRIKEYLTSGYLRKDLVGPTPAAPGATQTWGLNIGWDPSLATTDLQPEIIDLIPPQLTYVPGSFTLAAGQAAGCPVASDFEVSLTPNYLNGRTALIATTAGSGATVPLSDSCRYAFQTTVNPYTPAGTYGGTAGGAGPTDPTYPVQPAYEGNVAYLFDVRGYLLAGSFGKVADAADVNKNGDTQEGVSATTADFAVARSAALGVTKEVKGDRDTDFLGSAEQDPTQVGTSTAGGTVTYRVTLADNGNEPMTHFVAYDLLPYPDNTGVTASRYADHSDVNEWVPTLTGPIDTGSDPVTVYYSTNTDPCRPEMDNTGTQPFYCGGDVNAHSDWVTAGGVTNWSAVRAIRFDYGNTIIAPGTTYTYTWTMNVPTTKAGGAAFVGGERTWNKIAAQAASDVSGALTDLLPTEAPWVVDQVVPSQEPAGLGIVKEADTPGPFHVGDTVPYTYTVSNTGPTQITNLTVTDDRVTGITCESTTLAPQGSPGDSTRCHGSYVITDADAAAGHVTNTALASGTDPEGGTVESPPAEETVPVVSGQSSLSITKQSDVEGTASPGDEVTYTYTVTNTGQTALTDVAVHDDHVASVACDTTTLDPGQSTTCRGTYTVTEADAVCGTRGSGNGGYGDHGTTCPVTNTAHATALGVEGDTITSNTATATIQVTSGGGGGYGSGGSDYGNGRGNS
ncbi:hypothetical protein ACGFRB_12025 [Streptomyces sp. NPDC048718]|uniref:DUF7507 domain-containing protein n=1 Tax=Streptomyces sp. NPDC048718 TaxID=3365587 RepID=UPI003717AC76